MRIPAWLDPFWHIDFEIDSPLSSAGAAAALVAVKGRLRAHRSSDGGLIVVRRGGLLNQFVHARVIVDGRVQVHIARPTAAIVFLVLGFVLLVVIALLELLQAAIIDRPRLLESIVFFLIGTFIWVTVIGMNYTSARSEARDLEQLIKQALGVGA